MEALRQRTRQIEQCTNICKVFYICKLFLFFFLATLHEAVRHRGAIKGYGAICKELETAKGYTENESTIRIALSEPRSLT